MEVGGLYYFAPEVLGAHRDQAVLDPSEARRSVVDTQPRNLHIRCLRGHYSGNLSLPSTPQPLFTAGAMSSDPTAGMY
jgi:hypothetical protein